MGQTILPPGGTDPRSTDERGLQSIPRAEKSGPQRVLQPAFFRSSRFLKLRGCTQVW